MNIKTVSVISLFAIIKVYVIYAIMLNYGIQKNPTQESWTNSPKAYGHLIIDDTALGAPLIYNPAISDRYFIDWKGVRELLLQRGIISPK